MVLCKSSSFLYWQLILWGRKLHSEQWQNEKVSDIFSLLKSRQKYLFLLGSYSAGIGVWEGAVLPEKQQCVLGAQAGSSWAVPIPV